MAQENRHGLARTANLVSERTAECDRRGSLVRIRQAVANRRQGGCQVNSRRVRSLADQLGETSVPMVSVFPHGKLTRPVSGFYSRLSSASLRLGATYVIELAVVIRDLRAELEAAVIAADGAGLQFELGPVELRPRPTISMSWSANARAAA